MTTAQFAMVEELAFLIKDNLSSKHVVLSIEEALVNFLQDDTSPEGVLELEPMSPYHRMLLHRLADIYGFAHESVGEGDDRHIILERCPESSVPCVLVSDILWQCDDYQSPSISHQLLKRKEDLPVLKTKKECFPTSISLKEREAAYLAARQRIFAMNENQLKETSPPKQRNVPVVARRMIAHALGQRISLNTPCEPSTSLGIDVCGSDDALSNNPDVKVHSSPGRKADQDPNLTSNQSSSMHRNRSEKSGSKCSLDSEFHSRRKTHNKGGSEISLDSNVLQSGGNGTENLKREHYGAARRMFAQALGLPSVKQKS